MKKYLEKQDMWPNGLPEVGEEYLIVRRSGGTSMQAYVEPVVPVVKPVIEVTNIQIPAAELKGVREMLTEIHDMSRKIHFERVAAGIKESIKSHQLHLDLLDQVWIMMGYIQSIIKHEEGFQKRHNGE